MKRTGEITEANCIEAEDSEVQTVKVGPATLYVKEHKRGQHNEEHSPWHQDEECVMQKPSAQALPPSSTGL